MIKESDVRDLNPWWKDPSKIKEDKKIKEWEESKIKYDPRLRHVITYDFEPNNTVVYTLRGPRQVGKTTLVKLQIRYFLDKGVHPWNILYYSLDLANTQQDVVDLIETYLKVSVRQRGDKRSYLFLDEASSVPNWQKGIKWLVDNDKLRNCTIMATGSQAINLKNATERLPGRKGIINDSYDKILLPMKFVEYASLLNNDIKKLIYENELLPFRNREKILKKLLVGEVDEKIDKLNSYQNEISNLLNDYMLTGGTPKVIDEYVRTNTIQESIYTNYLESITGQWSGLDKNETLLKYFAGAIIESLTGHISWTNLAKNSALGSPNTAQSYGHTLHDLFVLSIIHRYGNRKKIPMIQKDIKFYFHDPFFLHIFNGLMSPNGNFETSLKFLEDEVNQSKVVEGIVADHIIRWAFSMSKKKQTYDYYNHVFYWKDDKNREVDFILYDGDTIEIPIEIKYRNRLDCKELAPMVNFLSQTDNKKGLVLSKSLFEVRDEYVIIPTSLFLMLI